MNFQKFTAAFAPVVVFCDTAKRETLRFWRMGYNCLLSKATEI
jgi:hypothetical protein